MGLKPKPDPTKEMIENTHSWAEVRNLHPLDLVLRDNGFRIHSRPPGDAPLWRKDNIVYTESEAASLCPRQDVANARGEGTPKEEKCRGRY